MGARCWILCWTGRVAPHTSTDFNTSISQTTQHARIVCFSLVFNSVLCRLPPATFLGPHSWNPARHVCSVAISGLAMTTLCIYLSPYAPLSRRHLGRIEAIKTHNSFEMVEGTRESPEYHSCQWTPPIDRTNYAFV
jgi:hypothetical protein